MIVAFTDTKKNERHFIKCHLDYQEKIVKLNARLFGYKFIYTSVNPRLNSKSVKTTNYKYNFNSKLKICRHFQCRKYDLNEVIALMESINYIEKQGYTKNIIQLASIRIFMIAHGLHFTIKTFSKVLRDFTGVKNIHYDLNTMSFNSKLDLIDWLTVEREAIK